jgi:hypothetical protein
MCLDHHHRVHTIDESNLLMNSAMAQPRREAMAARGGLSHLLDNFEDSRRPSSPSGLGSRFSSSSRWMDAELIEVRAINSPREP